MTAACVETLKQHDTAFLTGFTTRAACALIHLRDAWCNADDTNQPGVTKAIAALFTTRSVYSRPRPYLAFLRHGLERELAEELCQEVIEAMDDDLAAVKVDAAWRSLRAEVQP